MSKHTPAPWRIHEYGLCDPSYDILAEHKNVAIIIGNRRFGDNSRIPRHIEAEANARLIASAPELLKALKEMLYICDEGEEGTYSHEQCEKARQVIAKAEGTL